MADLRVKAGISLVAQGSGDGTPVDVRGTRDGAIFTAPWLTALALEGRCFGVNFGTGTTPASLTGAFVATTPDVYIQVPAGTTIIPVYIQLGIEDSHTKDVADPVVTLSSVRDTTPGGTALTIYNMRTDKPIVSTCLANYTATSVTTPYTGNFLEFFRGSAGTREDAHDGSTAPTSELNSISTWSISEATVPPVIVGDGSLSIYNCQTAMVGGTGWITVIWAEVPSKSIV